MQGISSCLVTSYADLVLLSRLWFAVSTNGVVVEVSVLGQGPRGKHRVY